MALARAHARISGRVQGVYYRGNTKKQADLRGLTGFTRNLPDGRVEAVFEGDEDTVKDMLRWCRKGPEMAYVEKVDVEWEKPASGRKHKSFEITY